MKLDVGILFLNIIILYNETTVILLNAFTMEKEIMRKELNLDISVLTMVDLDTRFALIEMDGN